MDNSAVLQRQLQNLKDIREDLNYSETETNGPELLRRLDQLYLSWKGQLPNLREIFGQKDIEHLLLVSIKSADSSIHVYSSDVGKSFINFVVSSGYRDEPEVDGNGKPVLRRATAVHYAARLNCQQYLVGDLFDIYNKFHVNYVDSFGLSHFDVACEYGLRHPVERFLELGHVDPKYVVADSGDSTLHVALRHRYWENEDVVEALLRSGVDPNLANAKGATPLHAICRKSNEKMMEVFFDTVDELGQTVQIEARDESGYTPLRLVAKQRKPNQRQIELLLLHGADPHLADWPLFLHDFCVRGQIDLVKIFFKDDGEIDPRVRIDALDNEGNTPLHLALVHGHLEIAELLLRRGADLTLINEQGQTPLDIVCKDRHDNVDLVKKMFVDSMMYVDKKKRALIVDDLLQAAVDNGNARVTEFLLTRGADPYTRSCKKFTHSHSALYRMFEKFTDSDLTTIVMEIIDKSSQPRPIDTRDKCGPRHDTLLHMALRNGRRKTAAWLLERDADANLPNAEGETPLHAICHCSNAAVDLAELFFRLASKRNRTVLLDAQDNAGNTPLHVALSYGTGGAMAEFLLSRGADSTAVNEAGETFLHVACKVARDGEMAETLFRMCDERREQVPLDSRDIWGNTPLHYLAYAGGHNLAMCELLLARGADPSLADNEGRTPLHIACGGQYIGLAWRLLNDQRVRLDARDREGNTALHSALEWEHMEVAALLLRRGADPNAAKANGETPLHVICKVEQTNDMAEIFFRICDEREQRVEVDAVDNLGKTPLKLAVARILPDTVDLLLSRGADPSNFAFPTDFGARIVARELHFCAKFKLVFDILAVVESLEKSGYDMDRDEALLIMRLFVRHGLIVELAEPIENFWRNDRKFANKAIELIVKPGLTLYELIQSGPKEAAKLVTLQEFRRFVQWGSVRHGGACAVHLCEKLSRGFFRGWAMDSFMKLIHYRLPLECCDMIVDHLKNQDLCNICLTAASMPSFDQ